jgi:recombination associated protein RdgC
MKASEATPIPPHLASEFYTWLWWASEQRGGAFDLPDPVGRIIVWVDDRLAFRRPDDSKVTAIMTGENPSTTLEARAALAGGKVVNDLSIGMTRDEKEFSATLKGPELHLTKLKLPQVLSEDANEAVSDRMFLYEEFVFLVSGLVRQYAAERTAPTWSSETLPAMRRWLAAEET